MIKLIPIYGSKEIIDLGFTVDERGRMQLAGNRIIERDDKGTIIRSEILPPAIKFIYDEDYDDRKRTFLDWLGDIIYGRTQTAIDMLKASGYKVNKVTRIK